MRVRIHAFNFHNNRVEDGAEVEASWGPLCLCHGAWIGENMGWQSRKQPWEATAVCWRGAGGKESCLQRQYKGHIEDDEREQIQDPGFVPQVGYVNPWGRNHGQRGGRLVKEGFHSGYALWSVCHLLHETLTPSLVFDTSYSSDSLLPNLPSCPNSCFYSTVCHTWLSAILRKK